MNSLFQEFSLLGCSAEKWRSFSFVSFLVYQILVYLLIGQFWLLLSTLQQSLCWWELQSGGGQRSDFEWCKVIVKEDTLKDFLQVNALAKNSDKKIPRRILYSLEKDVQEKTNLYDLSYFETSSRAFDIIAQFGKRWFRSFLCHYRTTIPVLWCVKEGISCVRCIIVYSVHCSPTVYIFF